MSVAFHEHTRDSRRTLCWISFGVLAVILALGFRGSWSVLINTWLTDTTFSHGLLIIPMSAMLVWWKRDELSRVDLRPSWLGFAWLAVSLAIWLLGRLAHLRLIEQVGLIGVLQALVPLTLGTAATRLLLFPLGFLWFAVPFGKELVPPLMEITADLSVFFLRLTGVPVYREGMLLQIPAGTYEVARACSGIKFLTAAVALGAYFGYLYYNSLRKRLIFVAVSIVVAILSNGLRAYVLVLIGHLTDMTFRHDRWHIVLGYVLFGIVLLLLFIVGWRYRDDEAPRPLPARAVTDAAPDRALTWRIAVLGLLLMAGVPVLGFALIDAGGSSDRIAAMSLRLTPAAGWVAAGEAAITWRPHISGGATRVEGSYRRDSAPVDVFIEIYPVPSRDDAEMVSYRNSIQKDANERLYADKVIDPHLPALAGLRVRETEIPGSPARLVWYWYDVAGHSTVSPARVKLAELRSVLTQGRAAQRVIVLSTSAVESPATARDRLREFVAAHGSQLVVHEP